MRSLESASLIKDNLWCTSVAHFKEINFRSVIGQSAWFSRASAMRRNNYHEAWARRNMWSASACVGLQALSSPMLGPHASAVFGMTRTKEPGYLSTSEASARVIKAWLKEAPFRDRSQ